MKEVKIPGTKTLPEVILNPDGIIKITGRSIHENTIDFYKHVEGWVKEYVKMPAEVTCIDFNLEYFNSASSKQILHLLQKLAVVELNHKKIMVNWYYEEGDDEIQEKGEFFSSLVHIPFNFIAVT